MTISFIIPAYNEEHFLGPTLERLTESAEAVGQPYEIIVVADGCTDGTAAIARQHDARVVEVELRHIAAVRNAGAAAAAGDLFIFVDADTLVPPETLAATVRAIGNGATGGGVRPVIDPPIPWWAAPGFKMLVCVYFRSMRFTLGGYLFATRAAFEAVGGFDEQYFAAEDAAFCRALRRHGGRVVLREPMITSGRKIESMSTWEGIATTLRLVLRGRAALRQREGLGVWYEQRTPRD
ncbi:MAG: glycosyltransferase [Planctomycetota bacterium]|jgi:cellulose synthase/poly-beta-1,6-N-acetylglucosamine synthase-like glycosyltransferase